MGYSPTQYNLLGFSQDGGFAPKFVAENEEFDARLLDRQEWFQFQFDISSPREENQWDLAAQDVPKPMPFVVSWDCLAKDNRRETDPVWENISRALALKASGVFLWPKRLQPFWGSIYRSFPNRCNDHSKVKEMKNPISILSAVGEMTCEVEECLLCQPATVLVMTDPTAWTSEPFTSSLFCTLWGSKGCWRDFFSATRVWEEKTATLRFVIGFFHFMKPLLGLGIVASMLLRFFRKRFTVCVMLVIKWDIQCLAQVLPYIQLLHNINRLDTYMKKCTYCMHTICAGSILDCLWSLEGVETVSLSPFLFRPFEPPQFAWHLSEFKPHESCRW